MNDEKVKRLEVEEKYARLVKDKKNYEDKERILLNVFDTLKKLNDKENDIGKNSSGKQTENGDNNIEDNVIDITGEDAGGTSSAIKKCNNCSYKTTVPDRLIQHMKDKHNDKQSKSNNTTTNEVTSVNLPCDECDYIASGANEYMEHTVNKHNTAYIICDICDATLANMDQLKKHVDIVHMTKEPLTKQNLKNCGHCKFNATDST